MDLDGARIGLDALERAKRTGELRQALVGLVAAAEPFVGGLKALIELKAKDLAEGREVEETQTLASAVERARKVMKEEA